MFGHDDHQNNQNNNDDQANIGPVTTPTAPVSEDSLGLGDESTASPAAPAADADNNGGFIMDPVPPTAAATVPPVASPAAPPTGSTTSPAAPVDDDLLHIKQQALQQLSPLVGHLDQTPEEKFRTTMMMIQASDDQNMVSQAYAAAQAIPDEKVRAQALLDIVNEINYFTQQHKDDK